MTCTVCDKTILPTESRTSINDVHYHGECFARQAAKPKKPEVRHPEKHP
jgi:hypothetical protein